MVASPMQSHVNIYSHWSAMFNNKVALAEQEQEQECSPDYISITTYIKYNQKVAAAGDDHTSLADLAPPFVVRHVYSTE